MKHLQEKLPFYALILVTGLLLGGCQQKVTIGTANKAFEKREYIVSADLYKRAYRSEADRMVKTEAAFGAAESYRRINDYTNASTWYSKVLQFEPGNLEALYQLALIQKSEEKYEEARKTLEQYMTKGGNKKEAERELEGCNKAAEWKKAKTRYMVVNERSLNSRYSDFAAVKVKDKEVFYTSDRLTGKNDKRYARTGDQYLAIFRAEIKRQRGAQPGDPLKIRDEEIPDGLEFDYNEGTCAFNQSTLYFTLCNAKSDGKGTCKIYEVRQTGKRFSEASPLSFCTDTSSSYGHPSMAEDGKTLYFSADIPGGFGGKDLYYVVYDRQKKSWSKPVNLGSAINTEKDEMFPYIHTDGTLFFSSNGHVGMGGLDLYYSTGNGSNWSEPVNMKAPINSGADDFAITLADDKETGMFSSNREGGLGKDDIYSFYLTPLVFNLQVLVKDANTGEVIPESTVKLQVNGDSSVTLKTDKNGRLELPLMNASQYSLFASKAEDYYLDSKTSGVSTKNKEQSEDFSIELLLAPINVEDEFTLKGIYYDLDKADIREDSKPVLDSLVTLLNKYPRIHIEIGSHTDCRSSKEYNLTLSQKRAQSVVDYLIAKGIQPDRLIAKGYGESRLVNDCACEGGVATRDCTDEEHQLNRRTTFRIISK